MMKLRRTCVVIALLGLQTILLAQVWGAETLPTTPSTLHAVYKSVPYNVESLAGHTEIWYRAPESQRRDMKTRTVTTDTTEVIHKNSHFLYGQASAVIWPLSQEQKPYDIIGEPWPHLFGTVASMMKELGAGSHVAGEEEILGRKCDVVEVADKKWPKVTLRVCIDRSAGLVSGVSMVGFGDSRLVALELDKPVPDGIFETAFPSGTFVYKAALDTMGGSQDAFQKAHLGKLRVIAGAKDDLGRMLREDHANKVLSLLKALYWPSYAPSRFRLIKVERVPVEFPKYEPGQKKIKLVQITYVDPKTGDTIIFIQGVSKWPVSGERTMKGGSFAGSVADGSDPFPFRILSWQRDDMRFTLAAANVSEPDLVKMAQSLKAVRRQ